MPVDVIVTSTRGPRGQKGAVGTATDGTPGANGTNGTSILAYSNAQVTNATAVLASLKSYSILAGQLASVGSKVIAEAVFDVDIVTGVKEVVVELDGTVCHTNILTFIMQEGVKEMHMKVEITYTAATTVDIKITSTKYDVNGLAMHGQGLFEKTFNVSNMASNANLIDFQGRSSAAADILRAQELTITYKEL